MNATYSCLKYNLIVERFSNIKLRINISTICYIFLMPHTNRNRKRQSDETAMSANNHFAAQKQSLQTCSDSIDSLLSQVVTSNSKFIASQNLPPKRARLNKFSPENLNRRLLASKYLFYFI